MGKINATLLLLYADGVVIAAQKGCSISAEQDLPDASDKDSSGWAAHINGLRNASVDFDSLFSTTGISAGELIDYIIGRDSLLLAIVGGVSYPMVAEVDVKNIKISADMENPLSCAGSFKVKGPFYHLKGTSADIMSDPDARGTDYDTFTNSGNAITSAINLAGSAWTMSQFTSITIGDVVKVILFLTTNSGELPSVCLYADAADRSNVVALVAGINIVTLTSTYSSGSTMIRFTNTAAANWSTSIIYAFKYVA